MELTNNPSRNSKTTVFLLIMIFQIMVTNIALLTMDIVGKEKRWRCVPENDLLVESYGLHVKGDKEASKPSVFVRVSYLREESVMRSMVTIILCFLTLLLYPVLRVIMRRYQRKGSRL